MSVKFSSSVQGDYLAVETTGYYKTVEGARKLIGDVYAEVARHGLSKLLVDDRECVVHMSLHEAMELHSTPGLINPTNDISTAVVCNAESYSLYRHFYTTHPDCKVFTSVEEALAWFRRIS